MHYNVSYKGLENPDREAIKDLVEWFGFTKSLGIFRFCRSLKAWWDNIPESHQNEAICTNMINQMNGIMMACEIGGVSGEPVLALMRRFFGDDLYRKWMDS